MARPRRAKPKMASSSQPPKKQGTLDGFLSQASKQASNGTKKRPIVIDLDDSDEDPVSHRGQDQKRAKTDAADSVSVSDGLDEGDVGSSSNPSAAAASEAAAPSAKSHRGWNHGVSNGLRTSFGAKTRIGAAKPSPDQTAPSPDAESAPESASTSASTDDAELRAWRAKASQISRLVKDWHLPPPKDRWPGDINWESQFEVWYAELCRLNSNEAGIWDADLVKDAWDSWLDGCPEMKRDSAPREDLVREMLKIAGWTLPPVAPLAQFQIKPTDTPGWQKLFLRFCHSLQDINQCEPHVYRERDFDNLRLAYTEWTRRARLSERMALGASAGFRECIRMYGNTIFPAMFDGSLLDTLFPIELPPAAKPSAAKPPAEKLPAEKPGERERYFPGIGPQEVFCVFCTSHNHNADTCVRQVCRGEKISGKQRGGCAERKCRLCQSPGHGVYECDRLWCTYDPESNEVRKIKSLNAYCYQCGEKGHYGSECQSRGAIKEHGPTSRTWSMANLKIYLDPECVEEAISVSFASDGVASSSWSGRPNLGKSIVPQRHILFEAADDDDDDAFIRPPVQRNAPGGISFQNGGRGFVPPLPPGPPPPLPAGPPPPQGNSQRSNNFRGGRYRGKNKKARGGRQ
ncbi:hypothetical protein B0T16DRAFT_234445 [Cercophora newfieldiana]|uniref:CCHC-type domain-containing protein n=1 Tax=Cercophora newfieldiana TaxID=92897 RepID=A0AA39XRI5_9PEZI|nr:hypothetical protein B0T16DRAFT_234445 [Cercophora newfieldiana]